MSFLDVQSIICQRLIDEGIAGGNVVLSEQRKMFESPAVFVSDSSTIGNTWEGWWETTIIANCVANSDVEALELARQVRNALDGWGGHGLEDVHHVSSIPIRTDETNPTTHARVLTFRVVYQE